MSIACLATDSMSGIASQTCRDVVGPAYSFRRGVNTFKASATDRAGNVGTGSARFRVLVSFDSLCALTKQFLSGFAVAESLCGRLDVARDAGARGAVRAKKSALADYVKSVTKQRGKMLSRAQAGLLVRLAGAL